MSFQDTARTGFYLSKETAWGEDVSSPTMSRVRITNDGLAFNKDTRTSDTIREDRQIDGVGVVAFNTGGDLGIEMAATQYNTLWEGLMDSEKVGPSAAITGVTAATTSTFTKSGIEADFVVGQWIFCSGFTNPENNGPHRVTNVSANTLTVASTLVVEGANGTIKAAMIRNGVTDISFLLEKQFQQAGEYHYYNGLRMSAARLALQAGELITGAFSFMGKDVIAHTSQQGATRNEVDPTDPMSASANVAVIESNNVTYAGAVMSLNLNISKNNRTQPKVGQAAAAGIGVGRFNLTGDMTVYFEDGTEFAAMRAHTYRSLRLILQDNAGEYIVWTMPKIVFTGGPVNADGNDRDVMLPLSFQAVRDPVTDTTLQFDTSSMTNW